MDGITSKSSINLPVVRLSHSCSPNTDRSIDSPGGEGVDGDTERAERVRDESCWENGCVWKSWNRNHKSHNGKKEKNANRITANVIIANNF